MTKNLPSLKYLEESFILDKDNGVLIWNNRPKEHFETTKGWKAFHSGFAGKQAGSINWKGYLIVYLSGKNYRVSRIIFYMSNLLDPIDYQIDHKNENKLDNRPENLRMATDTQNKCNGKNPRKGTKSGIRGVSLHSNGKQWVAKIRVNGKNLHLGLFKTISEAAEVYKLAQKKYRGDFAPI